MSETGKDIMRWMKLTEAAAAAAKTEQDKNSEELAKADSKIMVMKLDQLNRRIRDRYYQKDANHPTEKMFQFNFVDKGDCYEFTIPFNILFDSKTQKFCADYWDKFFAESDIKTSFLDNIKDALKQVSNVMPLKMKLNKSLTQEKE